MSNQLTLTGVQDSGVSPSPPNGQGSKPLGSVKSQTTPADCSQNDGQESPTSETCETVQQGTFTCLPAAIHASRFPLQDEEKERQMIATSGRQCATRLNDLSPIGAFSKMLLQSRAWFSPVAWMTWRQEAISARHSIFRLALLDYQAWNGTSGLLPRVTASDWKGVRLRSHRNSTSKERFSSTGGRFVQQIRSSERDGIYPLAALCEAVKGFPISWSALAASETPSRRPSRTKFSKQSAS